jgi:hypothetical protein
VHAYDPGDWTGFFAAVTGAAAALAGLLFVAVSINLQELLKPANASLPGRAAETLAMVLFVVVSAALVLVPQATWVLGAEILVVALPLTAVTLRNQVRYRRQYPEHPLHWALARMAATGAPLLLALLGGISLAAHGGGGLYWLVPSSLLGVASAVYSAWVMLVEILRLSQRIRAPALGMRQGSMTQDTGQQICPRNIVAAA